MIIRIRRFKLSNLPPLQAMLTPRGMVVAVLVLLVLSVRIILLFTGLDRAGVDGGGGLLWW